MVRDIETRNYDDTYVQIDGGKFRQFWKSFRTTEEGFKELTGMKRSNVQRHKRIGVKGMQKEQFNDMAKKLGLTYDQLFGKIGATNGHTPNTSGLDPATFDARQIPTWEVDLRASEWAQVPICELSTDDPEQAEVIRSGRFRIRLRGNCMEPDYPDGSEIELQIFSVEREGLIKNADYAVCRSDGTATFKKLIGWDDDTIELAAINQKDHPGSFKVPQQEIGRFAKVARLLARPLEPRAIKVRKG